MNLKVSHLGKYVRRMEPPHAYPLRLRPGFQGVGAGYNVAWADVSATLSIGPGDLNQYAYGSRVDLDGPMPGDMSQEAGTVGSLDVRLTPLSTSHAYLNPTSPLAGVSTSCAIGFKLYCGANEVDPYGLGTVTWCSGDVSTSDTASYDNFFLPCRVTTRTSTQFYLLTSSVVGQFVQQSWGDPPYAVDGISLVLYGSRISCSVSARIALSWSSA